jgi:hypothetical protein
MEAEASWVRELLLLLLCVSQHSTTGQIHEGELDHAASPLIQEPKNIWLMKGRPSGLERSDNIK